MTSDNSGVGGQDISGVDMDNWPFDYVGRLIRILCDLVREDRGPLLW